MADEIDKKIANTINDYIGMARQAGAKEGALLISRAWTLIKDDRDKQCLNDEVYSSAEHYLFARFLCSFIPSPVVMIGSVGYDALKAVPSLGPQFTKCPPSAVTLRQTKWKILGCRAGSLDFLLKSRHIDPVSPENTVKRAISPF
jgi:hypothetical protein